MSDLADDERSIEHDDEAVKDCNGRLIPRLIVRAPTMVKVSEHSVDPEVSSRTYNIRKVHQHILQSPADHELRERSLGSVDSVLHLDEPGLTQRSASAVTVLTAAAMEGTVQNTSHILFDYEYFLSLNALK